MLVAEITFIMTDAQKWEKTTKKKQTSERRELPHLIDAEPSPSEGHMLRPIQPLLGASISTGHQSHITEHTVI